jgi:hypothetical protein
LLSLKGGALPGLHPGALPALRHLSLRAPATAASVPSSWGAFPDVLPSLESLHLRLRLLGWLGPAWSGGFRRLRELRVEDTTPRRHRGACPARRRRRRLAQEMEGSGREQAPLLHATWAAGFPALQSMRLVGLQLGGGLPAAWLAPGAFPGLQQL